MLKRIKNIKGIGKRFFHFVIVSLLSVITTMTRVVKKQKVQIGTLKALGFSDFKILIHYFPPITLCNKSTVSFFFFSFILSTKVQSTTSLYAFFIIAGSSTICCCKPYCDNKVSILVLFPDRKSVV